MTRAATALADSSPSTYLEKRKLAPPFVGPLQLAGFIIGIVISGAFTGWNTGLAFGFINMAVAVGLATIMYFTLVLSVCEMCSALPFASGPGCYFHAALNSGAGALTGGVYATSYTLLSATVLVSLGNFITAALPQEAQAIPSPVYWLPLAALVLALNSRPRLLFRAAIVLSFYSCLLLVVYLSLAFLILPTKRNTPPNPIDGRTDLYYVDGQGRASIDTSMLSMRGIIAAFPFACWLYIGIESFPTASEEAKKIFRTAPTAGLYATFFLAFFAVTLLTTAPQLGGQLASVVVASGASLQHLAANGTSAAGANATPPTPMLADFSHSNHPLLDNVVNLLCSRYQTPLPTWCQPSTSPALSSSTDFFHKGHALITALVVLTLLPPLFLSLITGTYAAARHIYTLSRAGVLPTRISKTSPHGAPNYATLITLAAGMCVAGIIKLLSTSNMGGRLFATLASGRIGSTGVIAATADDGIGGFFCPTGDAETSLAILQVSAWLSCVSYVLEFASYILLYVRVAQLPRPFVSPLGVAGAAVGLVLALAFGVIGPMFVDPFFYGILLACVGAWVAAAVAYWVWVAKARMADSPEKIFVRLQIQQLYGRRLPGPAHSHPPGARGQPPDHDGNGPPADRRLDGSDRGRDAGTRTVLLSPRANSATVRVPGHGDRHRRRTRRAQPPRNHASQGTLQVHDHSMPTLAVHSHAGAGAHMSLPHVVAMCVPPAVPVFQMPPPTHTVTSPAAASTDAPGHDRWDWSSTVRLPAFLRYGSAFAYGAAATSEARAADAHAASATLMDHASATVPLRREWTGRQADEVTVTISQASDASDIDDNDDAARWPVRAATYPDPRLDVASPAVRRLTASSEALLTRDSGVTDLSTGRPVSMGVAAAPAVEGAVRLDH